MLVVLGLALLAQHKAPVKPQPGTLRFRCERFGIQGRRGAPVRHLKSCNSTRS